MHSNTLIPAKGRILISEPFMADPNFKRSVVLLTEHNEEGSFGFVLNQGLEVKVHQLLPGFPEFHAPVSLGGPVQQDSLHYIHTLGERLEGSHPVLKGLWWGGDFDQLREGIESGEIFPHEVRFFVGYSGWGAGQLQSEMYQKSWIVSPGKKKFALSPQLDHLWEEILQDMGKKYKAISLLPEDPSLN